MNMYLYGLLVSAGAIGALALLSAICALPWHLYYAKRGQKRFPESGFSYLEGLAYRGFMSFALPLMGLLIISALGQSVTARLSSAETEIKIDSTFSVGTYVRVARDDLPKDSRKMLGKNDVLFLRANANRNGDRVIIRAYENQDELKSQFPIGSKFELVEIRWRYRYPAPAFRFLGAVIDRTDIVKTQDGKAMSVKGLSWWSSIKS